MIDSDIHSNIDTAVGSVLDGIIMYGIESAPRGMRVKELLGTSITFNMQYPLVTRGARKLGYRFAPAEAAWILSGDNRLETIKPYSPFIWEFSDDGHFYSGAYGPKVVDQLTYVCDALSSDRATRQAVIEVWRPNPRAGRDIPCTLSFQFIVRQDMMHCVQSMRSSDAWLGYPYDAFNAAMLTGYVMLLLRKRDPAAWENVHIGWHHLLVGSQHLYEKNWKDAIEYVGNRTRMFEYEAFDPMRFASPQALIEHLWWLAKSEVGALRPDVFDPG